jgi:hypothetical protein
MNITITCPFANQYVIDKIPFLLAGGNIVAGTETVEGAKAGSGPGHARGPGEIVETRSLTKLTYQIDGGAAIDLPYEVALAPTQPNATEYILLASFSQLISISGEATGSNLTITVTATYNSNTTSTGSVTVQVVSFERVYQSKHWNLWVEPAYYSANKASFTTAALAWLETFLLQIIQDFGFSIFPLKPCQSQDGVRMDCVLDPAAQGKAYASTGFGTAGVSVSPDAIVNPGQFFWYILPMHETCNAFVASISSGWIWANGSTLWGGGSPFPNMCDIVVSAEVGESSISSQQSAREGALPDVALYAFIQTQYGWGPFQKLFAYVIKNSFEWYEIQEPYRTAATCYLLSQFCGTDLLNSTPGFNAAIEAVAALKGSPVATPPVSSEVYMQVPTLIPPL